MRFGAAGARPRPELLLLVALLVLAACGGERPPGARGGEGDGAEPRNPELPPPDESDRFPFPTVDAAGRKHVFPRAPGRIVSLVPSATQILVELGARERLVGRTEWDTAAVLRDLPSVGGGLRPSLERMVALEPELVIRFHGESDRVTPARLDELGIPHLAIRPDGIADVRRIIGTLAGIVGRPGRGDSLVAALDRELDEVRARVTGRARPTVAYLLGGTPPMVAGPDTFIDELIGIAGGTNAFRDLPRRYAPVSPEELVSRKIDVILHPARAALDPIGVDARTEGVSAQVETPGPHLARAAREVARLLHPDAFP